VQWWCCLFVKLLWPLVWNCRPRFVYSLCSLYGTTIKINCCAPYSCLCINESCDLFIGVKNNHIHDFGVHNHNLPIHSTTFIELHWWLRSVCRCSYSLLSIFGGKFSKSSQKLSHTHFTWKLSQEWQFLCEVGVNVEFCLCDPRRHVCAWNCIFWHICIKISAGILAAGDRKNFKKTKKTVK